jgi:glycosyltransferase involved in cell wall biosynthesis
MTQQGGSRLDGRGSRHPLVSIVCVTFNAADMLPRLVESITKYKTDAVEFIVIDGASTDNTIDIIKENEAVIDFWISEPDDGIYDAMNKSLNYIKGQWIIFLGADDFLVDGFNEAIALLKAPNTIYYGNVLFYGKEFLKVYDDYYLTKLNICHQALFYPAAVFEKYKYDLQYKVYADYDLNLRCWKDPRFKFEHLNYMIAGFSEGGFSTHTKDLVFEKDRDILFKKYLKRASYYRYLNRTLGFWRMFVRFLQNK